MAARKRLRAEAITWPTTEPRSVFERLKRRDSGLHDEMLQLLKDWQAGDEEIRRAIPGINELTRFANSVLSRYGLRISRASLTDAVQRYAQPARRSHGRKPSDANSAS